MPYAPTVNDNSGQILAQGINQGIGSLAEGIQRSIAERKKKEEDRKAKEAVNAAGKGLFGEDFDVKDAKPEQYGQLIQMAQAKRDEPMRKLAIENEGLKQKISQSQLDQYAAAAAQQARNQAATRGAFNPTTGTAQAIQGGADFANLPGPNAMDAESAMRYMGAQGADMATLQGFGQTVDNLAQAKQRSTPKPERRPERVDLGNGVVGVWDGNNFSRTNDPKADPNARIEFEVGGVKMVKQAGQLFNAKTGELVGPPKPLDPDTQSRLASRLSAAQAIADEPQGYLEGKTTFEKRVRDAQLKANLAAGSLGVRLPYDPAEAPAGRVGAPSPAARPATSVAPTSYKSAEAVRTAYRQGDLTREAAAAILQKQFGLQ